MKEHPIPQDVTGYRFHLVGNMTLKQFAELGAGCFLGFLFYNTNLVGPIKWTLIICSVGLGALVAFVPFEERPFDYWIVTFFKVLYKPTKFFWKRKPQIPKPFLYQVIRDQEKFEDEVNLNPAKKRRIQEYLFSVGQQQADPWEVEEKNKVAGVLQFFDQVQVAEEDKSVQSKPADEVEKPKLKTRIRTLVNPTKKRTQTQVVIFDKSKKSKLKKHKPSKVELKTIVTEEAQAKEAEQEVITNKDLPFPTKPLEKNKIVGMVIGPNNSLIQNAVVQIKNQQDQIARAVKTNSLGQFYISTPLNNGAYIINIEADRFNFEPKRIDLIGERVDPLEIRSSG